MAEEGTEAESESGERGIGRRKLRRCARDGHFGFTSRVGNSSVRRYENSQVSSENLLYSRVASRIAYSRA
jgi:hypothetical protein